MVRNLQELIKEKEQQRSEKNQILELLKRSNLTSIQIHELTRIKKEHVWIYLNELYHEKKIFRLNDSKPYIYFAVDFLKLLGFLNMFFKENTEYLAENPKIYEFVEKNEEVFNKIEKVLSNG